MLKQYGKFFSRFFFLTDLVIITISWFFTYAVIFKNPFITYVATKSEPFLFYLAYLIPVLAVSAISMRAFSIYRPRRMDSIRKELIEIATAFLFILLFLVAVSLFLQAYSPKMNHIIIFSVTSIFLLSFQRVILREVLRYVRRRGYNLKRTLLVGTEGVAKDIIGLFLGHPEFGIRVVGFVSEYHVKVGSDFMGYSVIGHYTDINSILEKSDIDQIIVTFDPKKESELPDLLKTLACNAVDVKVMTDSKELTKLGGVCDYYYGFPIVSFPGSPLYGWRILLKRVEDILLSIIAILLAAPFMLVIALVIKLTSPGSVFYKQERMSVRGRRFQMLKFRSMTVGAEDKFGPIWAIKGDKRNTRVGTFIRRKSLDELPQLFNVLKGEMSLVGPRPEREVFIEEFKSKIPKYMQRHKIKSGITGWAQANDLRGRSDMDERFNYDLYYIRHWSFLFDIKIMWLTLCSVFSHKNAY